MDGVFLRRGDGQRFGNNSRSVVVKSGRPEFTLLEFTLDEGFKGPPLHLHRKHADAFYVLEGEIEFRLGDETIRAGAGTFVLVPPGVPHAFSFRGPGSARMLNIHAPGGFDEYVRRGNAGEKPDPVQYDQYNLE